MKNKSRPFRILIVDDCPDDISHPYLLSAQLGCDVTLALDGRQALSSIETANFDLIILDWNMPIMSGHDFLRSVRAQGRGLNIVLYTGNEVDAELRATMLEYRILDLWEKPIGPIEILKRMKTIREEMGR